MDDKTKLLEQLRIDRSEGARSAPDSRRSAPIWLVYALILVIVAGLGSWFFLRPHPGAAPAAASSAADGSAATDAGTGSSSATGSTALDASGYVVAQRQATVSAKALGRVIDLRIEEGQRVREGEIVARLDDTNTRAMLFAAQATLAQTQASLDAAKVAFADAGPIFERNQKQHLAAVISAQDFDADKATYNAVQSDLYVKQRMVEVAQANVQVAQRNEDDMTVRAPFDGVITVKVAQKGEIVSPNTAGGGFARTGIGTMVDMDSLEVEVDVSENFINRVHLGQPATVRLNAYPDWSIPAAVKAIIPTADRSKATVKVRVSFKEKDPRILPEMGARVSFLNDAAAASSAPATVSNSQNEEGISMAAVVSIQNVVKSYTRGRQRVEVLHSLNLEVQSGEFLGLMGPSGSGKTTLLNLIGGLDKPDEGQITVAGERLDKLSGSQMAAWRARHVGFVFQFYNLLPVLSAERNVEVPLLLTKLSRAQRKSNVAAALALVGLSDRASHKPTELSGGQQQRVAIARALIADPTLLVCDEPTGDLDRESAEEILQLLTILNQKQGKTIVMVTHDPRAAAYATRLLHMDKGTLARDETRTAA